LRAFPIARSTSAARSSDCPKESLVIFQRVIAAASLFEKLDITIKEIKTQRPDIKDSEIRSIKKSLVYAIAINFAEVFKSLEYRYWLTIN